MQARASAVEELQAAGTFEDLTALGPPQDDVDRELDQLDAKSAVDNELAKLETEVGSGPPVGASGWRASCHGRTGVDSPAAREVIRSPAWNPCRSEKAPLRQDQPVPRVVRACRHRQAGSEQDPYRAS